MKCLFRPPMQPQMTDTQHQMRLRQQQIINEHFATVPQEQRQAFNQMSLQDKQAYLRQRNLLIAHPGARQNINLTVEQRQHLQVLHI